MLIKGSTFSGALRSKGQEDLFRYGTIGKYSLDIQQPLGKALPNLALTFP